MSKKKKKENKRPYFSIIIPTYNCKNTIERLLLSILNQNLKKEEYEVIICDDRSTDNFFDNVYKYYDQMNIIYCNTKTELHCPGNTRKAALPIAIGEWITFIDNDDMFEPDVFNKVRTYIKETKEQRIVCTNFRELDIDNNKFTREFIGDKADTWLHGTFYNKDNLIDKFAIDFKQDLYSHEDVYFNSCILSHLIGIGEDYNYMNLYTYQWVLNPKSTSRTFFNEKHFYIEVYLSDYITACTEPWIQAMEIYKENEQAMQFYFHQLMMGLLHVYFYYQGFKYRLGDDIIPENLTHIHNMKTLIKSKCNVTNGQIIDYIYNHPTLFTNIRRDSMYGVGNFVEVDSFKDFINNI